MICKNINNILLLLISVFSFVNGMEWNASESLFTLDPETFLYSPNKKLCIKILQFSITYENKNPSLLAKIAIIQLKSSTVQNQKSTINSSKKGMTHENNNNVHRYPNIPLSHFYKC